jgi:hypothetical protein
LLARLCGGDGAADKRMVIVVVSVGDGDGVLVVVVIRRRALDSLDGLNATHNFLQPLAVLPRASQGKLQQQVGDGDRRVQACHPHRLDLLEQRLRCATDRAGEVDDLDEGVLDVDGLAALQLEAEQAQTQGAVKVDLAAPSVARVVEHAVEEFHGNAQHRGSSSGGVFRKGELGVLDDGDDSAFAPARVSNCTGQGQQQALAQAGADRDGHGGGLGSHVLALT